MHCTSEQLPEPRIVVLRWLPRASARERSGAMGATTDTTDDPAGTDENALASALVEVLAMGRRSLRLRDVDDRIRRIGELEDAVHAAWKTGQGTRPPAAALRDSFVAVVEERRRELALASLSPGVVADVVTELEIRWRDLCPGMVPESAAVLVVLYAHPDDPLLGSLASSSALRPTRRTGRVPRASRRAPLLVSCPEWCLRLFAADPGPRGVGVAHHVRDADERDAVASLWDEDPSGGFHELATVLSAVRLLG